MKVVWAVLWMTVCIAEFRSVWHVPPSRSMSKHCTRKKVQWKTCSVKFCWSAHSEAFFGICVRNGIFYEIKGCYGWRSDLQIHMQQEWGNFQMNENPTPPGFHNTMITSVTRVYEGSQKQGTWKTNENSRSVQIEPYFIEASGSVQNHMLMGILSWTKPGKTNHIYSHWSQRQISQI